MSYKLRIKFSKYAHMIFIGHLDLMRYFQKAIRRAGIDISYSGGFSPHQIMSFAQPLGVGVFSGGEYMDISVESLTSAEQAKNALQSVMAEGVDILSVRLLPDDAINSMASIAAASYSVTFREGKEPSFDMESAANAFYAQDSIMVEKTTKKGSRMVDLKEHIYSLSYDSEARRFEMLLDASSGGNIKPFFVINEIYSFAGQTLGEFDLLITREEIYANGPDGGYIPLEEAGRPY